MPSIAVKIMINAFSVDLISEEVVESRNVPGNSEAVGLPLPPIVVHMPSWTEREQK